MNGERWDDAGKTALRQATALFGASSLAWFDALCRPRWDDPSAAFERLLRASMGSVAETSASTAEVEPSHAADLPQWPTLERSAPLVSERFHDRSSGTRRLGRIDLPARFDAVGRTDVPPLGAEPAAPAPAVSPSHVVGSVRTAGAFLPRLVSEPAASPSPPRVSVTVAEAADLAPTIEHAFDEDISPAVASTTVASWPEAATTRPGRRGLLETAAIGPSAHGGIAPLDEPHPSSPSVPARDLTLSRSERAPQRDPLGEPKAALGRTTLVSGVPALKDLLQSAVDDSRSRHALARGFDDVPSPRIPGSIVLTASAPEPPRAFPVLDPLAEEILVDRLADQLEERFRDQALRHFGLTGGLT